MISESQSYNPDVLSCLANLSSDEVFDWRKEIRTFFLAYFFYDGVGFRISNYDPRFGGV